MFIFLNLYQEIIPRYVLNALAEEQITKATFSNTKLTTEKLIYLCQPLQYNNTSSRKVLFKAKLPPIYTLKKPSIKSLIEMELLHNFHYFSFRSNLQDNMQFQFLKKISRLLSFVQKLGWNFCSILTGQHSLKLVLWIGGFGCGDFGF